MEADSGARGPAGADGDRGNVGRDPARPVLVIDEGPVGRIMLGRLLAALGRPAVIRDGLAEAGPVLRKCREAGAPLAERPEAIVVAARSDRASGPETLAALSADAGLAALAVVAATPVGDARAVSLARGAGAGAIFFTPGSASALERALSEAARVLGPVATGHSGGPAAAGPPKVLPGFDLAEGLYRLGGNWAVYAAILKGFATEYGQAPRTLADLADQGQWPAVARLAHTVKGAAGNVSAVALRQAALAVEEAAEQDDAEVVRAALPIFTREMDAILATITTIETP